MNLAVDAGNFEVAETLRRYPEGKAVTVVYNPAAPQECILERDDPANIRNAWLAVAVLVGLIAAGFVAITQGADWLSGIVAKPARTPLVVVLGLFALVMAVFARMVGLEARAVRKWPTTPGRITQSEVVTTTQEHRRARSGAVRYVTMYVPRIVFTYQVDGTSFKGDNIGWSGSASTPALAEKHVKRYAASPGRVFYNPQDPTKSHARARGRNDRPCAVADHGVVGWFGLHGRLVDQVGSQRAVRAELALEFGFAPCDNYSAELFLPT